MLSDQKSQPAGKTESQNIYGKSIVASSLNFDEFQAVYTIIAIAIMLNNFSFHIKNKIRLNTIIHF